MTPRMEMEADVRAALRQVIDPELGYNIVDLGMIYDVAVGDEGAVDVVMTTTTKFCPATTFLKEGVEACVSGVAGVRRATVELTYDPPWDIERAVPEIARRFFR